MFWVGALCLAVLAGCSKKEAAPVAAAPVAPKPPAVEVVKETERSRHFLAVTQKLELGGTLYGYADVDGDAVALAGALQGYLGQMAKTQPQMAPVLERVDLPALVGVVGLGDVKAVGVSSVPDGTGFFRNRAFFYTPDGRHGLLAGLGGAPAPFARLHLAPADTDLYVEAEMDVPAIYKTVLEVVTKVGGESTASKFEQELRLAGQKAAVSVLSVVQNWKGRSAMVLRMNEGPGISLPPPSGMQLPSFSFLISVDGIAPTLRDSLLQLPMLEKREEGGREIFQLKEAPPMPGGLNPIIAIEGSTLMLATNPEFMAECLSGKGGLAEKAEFKAALAPFGNKGNGLSYYTPRLFQRLRAMEALNAGIPAQQRQAIDMLMAQIPEIDRPLVTVRTNLPDGILVESYWNRSLKQDVAMVSVYNPVTIGLMAAMAIPAFQKVRTESQRKAVVNNLRQLAAAADQYYLENGKNTATYADLVGPDKYIRQIDPVAGENYRQLQFRVGQPLRVRLSTGVTVQYPP